MLFSKRLFSVLLFAHLTSCASKPMKEPQEGSGKKTEVPSTVKSAPVEMKVEANKVVSEKNVLDYFFEVYPKGSGRPVSEMSFEDKDIKNGYLKITGAMEGYFLFVLFRGTDADWILEQGSECGPECSQDFKVYKFVGGKLKGQIPFERLYPKKKVEAHLDSLMLKLPKGSTGGDLQSWLRLPRTGTSIEILILEQNPGHVSGSAGVYRAGHLEWVGSEFNFIPMNPTEVSSIGITAVQ